MDIKEIWEADRLRTERVRAIPADEALDETLASALGVSTALWLGASNVHSVCMAALAYFRMHFRDRVGAFAQRLLDEVAPWATSYDSAIELTTPEMPVHTGLDGGSYTVLAILTAEPAAIVRAIILALPER